MSRGHLFILAILTALAIGWLLTLDRAPQDDAVQLAIEDDYHLDDFELDAFDHDGRKTHRVTGKALRQRSGSHDFELDAPHFVLLTEAGQWDITARTAWMDAAMSRAELRGEIIALGKAPDPLTVTTADLALDLSTKRATTDALVNITQGDNRLRGEALTANLASHRLRLRHSIEGYYVP